MTLLLDPVNKSETQHKMVLLFREETISKSVSQSVSIHVHVSYDVCGWVGSSDTRTHTSSSSSMIIIIRATRAGRTWQCARCAAVTHAAAAPTRDARSAHAPGPRRSDLSTQAPHIAPAIDVMSCQQTLLTLVHSA